MGSRENVTLREWVRTNDVVLVSAIGALLDGANIHHLVLDQNMSVIEGSLGVLPRRILVHEDDNREARQLLTEAGLGVIDEAFTAHIANGHRRRAARAEKERRDLERLLTKWLGAFEE